MIDVQFTEHELIDYFKNKFGIKKTRKREYLDNRNYVISILHEHFNYSEDDLAILGVATGDSFMGVSSDGSGPVIRSTDQGKQRLMGPFYPDLTSEQRIVEAIIHPIQLLSTPLSFDGEVMSDIEGKMLDWNPAEKILINGIFWFF